MPVADIVLPWRRGGRAWAGLARSFCWEEEGCGESGVQVVSGQALGARAGRVQLAVVSGEGLGADRSAGVDVAKSLLSSDSYFHFQSRFGKVQKAFGISSDFQTSSRVTQHGEGQQGRVP